MIRIKNEIIWYGKVLVVSFIFFFAAFNIIDGPVWAGGNTENNPLAQALTARFDVIAVAGIMAFVLFVVYKRIKKAGRKQISTSYWEAAETLLSDPHTRPELRKAIKTLDRMRPVDALQDAVTLYNLQQIRAKEIRKA